MAVSKRVPNTIAISPSQVPAHRIRNDLVAAEAITPGMLVELSNDATYGLCWGVHDSANEPAARAVALDEIELNHGIDTAYTAGDLVKVGYLRPGDRFYGIIPSGQNITQGALLQSNGDGKLKAYSTGPGGFVAASSPGSVTEDTRLWVEVL
jgi:hypothetical protein